MDPDRSRQYRAEPVRRQPGSYPSHPAHWPRPQFQWSALYLKPNKASLHVCSLYFKRDSEWRKWCRQQPLVRLYISPTVLVERSLRGWPLSPPASDLCGSLSVSGLDTVVLDTIKPSTPNCEHREKTTGCEWCVFLHCCRKRKRTIFTHKLHLMIKLKVQSWFLVKDAIF